MLDLELVEGPTQNGLDIVSRAEQKVHMRISAGNTAMDAEIDAAVLAAADALHGRDGTLNRSVFPTTWRRYLSSFPTAPYSRRSRWATYEDWWLYSRTIQLPYPPLIEVLSVEYDDGESPLSAIDPGDYTVRLAGRDGQIGEIELNRNVSWPQYDATPRGIAITFRAGYTAYPEKLKQLVKILAAHNVENKEATINEPRQMQINRRVDFGVDWLTNLLKVPTAYDDWE